MSFGVHPDFTLDESLKCWRRDYAIPLLLTVQLPQRTMERSALCNAAMWTISKPRVALGVLEINAPRQDSVN